MKSVLRSRLGPIRKIAAGQFGVVHQVDNFRLSGDGTRLAYKEFLIDHADQARSAESAILLRQGLTATDRVKLDRVAVWPLALVVDDNDAVVGLLMPLLQDAFQLVAFDHLSQTSRRLPRDLTFVVASKAQLDSKQVAEPPLDLTERLIVLMNLVYAIGLLHRMNRVYGDLSFTNVIYSRESLAVKLIDCDVTARSTDPGRKQSHTLSWELPEGHDSFQDSRSDIYKLGLMIARCLAQGSGRTLIRGADHLFGLVEPDLARAVGAAVERNPDARPTARNLFVRLEETVTSLTEPPEFLEAAVVNPRYLRGEDIQVTWQVRGADELALLGPNGLRVLLPSGEEKGRWSVRDPGSGPTELIATNPWGESRITLGSVTVFELPTFSVDRINLPAVNLPQMRIPRGLDPTGGQQLSIHFGNPPFPKWLTGPERHTDLTRMVASSASGVPWPQLPPFRTGLLGSRSALGQATSSGRGSTVNEFDQVEDHSGIVGGVIAQLRLSVARHITTAIKNTGP